MEPIVRNIRDLDEADRVALERIIQHKLRDEQQIIVKIVDLDLGSCVAGAHDRVTRVPDWWKIYEGLSDLEIDELDDAIRQRADLTRRFE